MATPRVRAAERYARRLRVLALLLAKVPSAPVGP